MFTDVVYPVGHSRSPLSFFNMIDDALVEAKTPPPHSALVAKWTFTLHLTPLYPKAAASREDAERLRQRLAKKEHPTPRRGS